MAARIRLHADANCKKCEGRGVYVKTDVDAWGKATIEVRLCQCLKGRLSGRVRLPIVDVPISEETEVRS